MATSYDLRLAVAILLGVLGCESRRISDAPTAAELPAIVAKYEAFITKVAEVTKSGTCEEKWTAVSPLFVMHKETDTKMIAAMSDPALRDELQKLIEARGTAISDPEIAFVDVKHTCAGKAGFAPK